MIKDYFEKNDIFNVENGIHVIECEEGRAVLGVELTEKHMSLIGRPHAHAGVLYSLAESAGAAAVLSYGYPCYGFTGEITYTGTATDGMVTAEAKCKDCHDQPTGDIRVRIYDKDKNIIGKAKFVVVYTGEPKQEY